MKRLLTCCIAIALYFSSEAQTFVESFTDGNFTANPLWSGNNNALWIIVAPSQAGPDPIEPGNNTLRLTAFASAFNFLSTPNSTWGASQEWGLWLGSFGPLTGPLDEINAQYFWLYADNPDLNSVDVNGYRLALVPGIIPGDPNLLQLQKVSAGGGIVVMQELLIFALSSSDFGFRVRVTRSDQNEWTVYTALDLQDEFGVIYDGEEPSSAEGISAYSYLSIDNPPYLIPPTGTVGYFGIQAYSTKALPALPEFDEIFFQATAALPVNLISFTAIRESSKVKLDWKVGLESNVDGYEIQRSINGRDFQKIGFVKATGASSYRFTDNEVLPGKNYYRLKTKDIDASFEYSKIITVNGANGHSFKVYPNPVNNRLFIRHSVMNPNARIQVIGMDGRVVRSARFLPNSIESTLDVSSLSPGIYHLIIDYGNGEKELSKFVKQ